MFSAPYHTIALLLDCITDPIQMNLFRTYMYLIQANNLAVTKNEAIQVCLDHHNNYHLSLVLHATVLNSYQT